MKLKDSQYDFLKWLAIYCLPSLAAFTGVCGIALQWEYTAVTVTIINALGSLIAGWIRMSVAEYEKAKKEQYEGGADESE